MSQKSSAPQPAPNVSLALTPDSRQDDGPIRLDSVRARHRRSLLQCMEQAHRPAPARHLHRLLRL